MSSIMILDLEVENKPYYGGVASLHNPENYIVAPGWRIDTLDSNGYTIEGKVEHRYFESLEEANNSDWFKIPDDCWCIVAHNAMYELMCLLCRHREELEKFLKRGGRVACTALAEYLLSHQQTLYPALDDVAIKYGGTHKIDGVKAMWEAGMLTSQIDRDLLIEYLAGPEGDVVNTAKTFYGQLKLLVENEMDGMFWERCDGMLAYSYCEYFGMHVDTEIAERNLAQQEARVAEIQEELNKLLPEFPEGFEFNWGSYHHKSALIYGGPIKFKEIASYNPPQYINLDVYKLKDSTTDTRAIEYNGEMYLPTECPSIEQSFVTYASGKNKGLPKVFKIPSNTEKKVKKDSIFQFKGLIDLNQLPQIYKEKFLSRRAEFRSKLVLSDGTPVYSTNEDALECIKNLVPQVSLLLELGSLKKDNGTYYRAIAYNKDGSVKEEKGMLQFVQPDGIVHHNLNITATVTGRLSSSRPNLQNLPRDGTSKVKEMFTSRYGKDGRIIEVDYSAIEVVMLAALTKDYKLLELLISGTDMHCYRLAFKLNEPYEEVYKKCHDKSHPEHKKYKQLRTEIKTPSFAAQYGATAAGIAFASGCTVEFAQEFLDLEARLFPVSVGYRQVIYNEVVRTGNLQGNLHSEMTDYGERRIYRRGYWKSPAGTCYSFRQQEQWKDGQQIMDYKATQIANYWCQGEAGFLMVVSMGRVCRWLIANDWFNGRVCLINNVHDAVYLDVENEEIGRVAGLGAKSILEDAPKYMTDKWPAYDMANIPFPAEAEIGINMMEKKTIE